MGRSLAAAAAGFGVWDETASQRSVILQEGCEQGQGYLIGSPSEDADLQSPRNYG